MYGPYGYDDPSVSSTDTTVRRMRTGFVPRNGANGTDNLTTAGRNALPKWNAVMRGLVSESSPSSTYAIPTSADRGPAVGTTYVIGYWCEDFAYLGELANPADSQLFEKGVDFDLDVYNGRLCRTPEYPNGTYAYFASMDAAGLPEFPYVVGRQYYGSPTGGVVTSITETTTVAAVGGPNAPIVVENPVVDSTAGTVTVIWNSAEGGSCTLASSPDLDTWTNESGISTIGSKTVKTVAMSTTDTKQFYRVKRDSLATYDVTGSTATVGGPGGSGAGAVPGTGTPATGYVFSFADGPPMANLISNLVVENLSGSISVSGTVVAYVVNGPMVGTITIPFNNSTLPAGTYYSRFTATPPGSGPTVSTSTNTYVKP